MIALGVVAGGFLARKSLLRAADSLIGKLAAVPAAQHAAHTAAVKTFDALERVAFSAGKVPILKDYFRPSQSPILRRDLTASAKFLRRDLSRHIVHSEASKSLAAVLSLSPDGNWEPGKIEALLQDKGFFQSLLYPRGVDPQQHIRSILETDRGAFHKYLGTVDDSVLDKTAKELAEAIHGGPGTRGIDLRGIRKDAVRKSNPLRLKVGEAFAAQYTQEGQSTNLERLFGLRQGEASTLERRGYEKSLRVPEGTLKGLRQDWLNGEVHVGERKYDLSGYVRIGQHISRAFNEKLAIPFAPLQTAVSPGQLFPFLKRAADSPKIGLLDENYLQGKFRLHVHDQIIHESGQVEAGRFDFLRVNKRHLKELVDARREAANESGKFSLKNFLGFKTTPGSTPYWDAPMAFLRKFSKKGGRNYLPNILKSASEGHAIGKRDALDIVTALRHSPRFMEDSEVVSAVEGIKSLGVKGNHERLLNILTSEGTSTENWSEAYDELRIFVASRRTSSPRLQKIVEDLAPFAGDKRALQFELGQTASYRASRPAERFLGLKLGGAGKRFTRLDVIKHDVVSALIDDARGAGKSSAEIAGVLKGAGQESLSMAYAHGIEEAASKGTLQEYLKAHPDVAAHLGKVAKKSRNFLDMAPKERAEWEDFTDRQRILPIRKGRDPVSGPGKAKGAAPNKEEFPDTRAHLFAYWQVARLHEFAENLGWGLPASWRTSAPKLAVGLLLGRVLPLALLPEAYKLVNRITHDVPFLRWANPDAKRSHILKVASHISHRVINHKHLTGLLPGLDFYTDSRSAKEQDQSARYADYTPVRKGRWWLFGSREAVFGTKVNYYLPSAGRLAASDWQAAKNVDRNTWKSWTHFGSVFNPINWFDPYWRENRHVKDWGLSKSAPLFDPGWITSQPLNAILGWMKPRRFYNKEYLPPQFGGTATSLDTENPPGTTDPGIYTPTYKVPVKSHLTDPSRLGLGSRRRGEAAINESRANEGIKSITHEDYDTISRITTESALQRSMHNYQEVSGLYGWMAGMVSPEISRPQGRIELADASRGYSVEGRFWDQELGGIGGTTSDILRRFFPHRRRSIHQYDPAPNDQPDWMPLDFHHGNVYARITQGFLRLPGEAYRRSHPGVEEGMWKMRASSLGKTPEEMREYFLHPEGDGRTSQAAEIGTQMHRVLQARWKSLGILEADEVSIYDKEHQISGHIDGILRMRMENGELQRTIVDIKTKTTARFNEVVRTGKPEEENLEQIQFYMMNTGIHHALLTYVNRDNPNQVYELPVAYDPELMKKILSKLEGVRNSLKQDIKKGKINEGAVYAPIDRYEILSDVSPYSDEFRKMAKWASNTYDSMSPDEKYRIDSAKARMKRKREGFELHDYRFRGHLKKQSIVVNKILSETTVEDKQGQRFQIAGIKSTGIKDSPYKSVKEMWQKEFGVTEGMRLTMLTDPTQNARMQKAVVLTGRTNIAKRMMRLGLATEDIDDNSSPAIRNRFSASERTFGKFYETLAHINTPLATKILPVRSGLEQYERTDVYGKAHGDWSHPIRDYISPTLESMMNKGILSAAAMGAFVGAQFGEDAHTQLILAGAGAAVSVVASLIGKVGTSKHKPPIPRRVRERRAVEEYYDNLTYLKYKALAAQEATLAYEHEGINVDDLRAGHGTTDNATRHKLEDLSREKQELREEAQAHKDKFRSHLIQDSLVQIREEEKALQNNMLPLGSHALRAVLFRDRSLSTLRGSLETGDVNAAIRALPQESRQAIEDVIRHGTKSERERLYDLLPQNQKAVLGSALGKNPKHVPHMASLGEYFAKNPLPSEKWAGWSPDLSLELIEAKDIVENHKSLDPMDFGLYPGRIEEATLMSPEASVSSPERAAHHGHLQARIESLLAGHGLQGARIEVRSLPPSFDQSSHQAHVTVKVKHRREHAHLAAAMSNF